MFTTKQAEDTDNKKVPFAISKLLASFGNRGKAKDEDSSSSEDEDDDDEIEGDEQKEDDKQDGEGDKKQEANEGEEKEKPRDQEAEANSMRDIGQDRKEADKANAKSSFFGDMASNFMKLAASKPNSQEQDNTISTIVQTVCERSEEGDAEENASLQDILNMISQYKGKITEVASKYGSDIDLRKLSPNAVAYYLEKEDELKNPSWRRRQHRFCPGIKIDTCYELNDALEIALLAYADTADEIREALAKFRTPYELAYCSVSSSPGQPAHFVAVKRNQSSNSKFKKVSSSLKVLIGVRGTKTPADAITDLICDPVDYADGKAHSMILESGKYVAEKHLDLLEKLREKAKKKTIKVTLIGHSLGAGAASIAGMELRAKADKSKIIVKQVVGFGCPALVSKELAEKATYITTVINRDDVVPRMSGATAANLLIDMMTFNWLEYARTDIHTAVSEIQKRTFLMSEAMAKKILSSVDPMLEKHFDTTRLERIPKRIETELFPPGNCIHFYDDGRGISGAYVPNTFFSEIDVTRRMVDDHLFFAGYEHSLLQFMRQESNDHHFRFDKDPAENLSK